MADDLHKHQLVRWKGKVYCLTRLGFGLNVAPKIMSKILKTVLGEDKDVEGATSSYIDDIYVDVTKVGATSVIEHLRRFGLEAKQPEMLEGGTALGLRLERDGDGGLNFSRGSEVPGIPERRSKPHSQKSGVEPLYYSGPSDCKK